MSIKTLPGRSIAIVFLSTLTGLATAGVQPGSAEAQADWEARASNPSVLYATNFDDVYLDGALDTSRSGIVTQADLHQESFENGGSPNNQYVTLDTNIRLSGANSCVIITPGSAGNTGGGYFAFRPDGRTSTARHRLYVQFSVYYPKETIGYRFLHDGDSYLKTINFGQYGAGQVVIGDTRSIGFPVVLLNGTNSLGGEYHFYSSSETPWGIATSREQPAIDNGASLGPGDSKEAWLNNYGILPRAVATQDGEYGYDASNPYLYNRGMPFGWPDSRALASGAIAWQRDGWTTVEAYLEYNGSGPVSTIKIWATRYGEAPRLIVNEVGTVDLGSDPDNAWSRFELLNYATGRQAEATRPTQRTYYDEVVVSTAPIDFPGGYDPLTESVNGPLESGGSGGSGGSLGGGLSGTAAPDWVHNIQPGHWAAVSINTLSDVDPEDDPAANPNYPDTAPWHGNSGQRAVMTAWNGGTLATGFGSHGSLLVYGGGHADYYGSEVYSFDLATRTWQRLTNPYPGPFNWPYSTGSYPDGSAIPPHTYDYSGYDPESNSFVILKGQNELGPPSNETSVDIPHLLDLDTLEWRRGPVNADDPNLFSGGHSAYDSKRGVFWANGGSGANHFVAYDPDGENSDGTIGTWQTYPNQMSMTDSQAEYDPKNDILLVTGFRDGDRVYGINLSNPDERYVALVESGPVPDKTSQSGWSWSYARQAVLYYSRNASNDSVYEFRLSSGDWKTGEWTWGLVTATDNSVIPEDSINGVYGRFQVVSYADAEIVVLVNSTTGPVYAFRVPEAVRPMPPDLLNN